MIDLRTAQPGDKLISRHGMVLTYRRRLDSLDFYGHQVVYPNGSFGSRVDDGHVYKNPSRRLPEDHDIVEIVHKEVWDIRQMKAKSHNSSTKPSARIKHSLWALEHAADIQAKMDWNRSHGAHKWSKLRTVAAKANKLGLLK